MGHVVGRRRALPVGRRAWASVRRSSRLGTLGRDVTTPFKGLVDEVRVIKTVLSADWIAAEHANLNDAGFVSLGPEEMH